MKKSLLKLLSILVIFILITFALNITVTTRQGVNYKVREIKLPLYLKALDFVDRHYNYKNVVKYILGGSKNDSVKTIKIFNWVVANVKKNPKELPIIDDHPLNILIRGYGMVDQFEDVFTILCTYAGLDSFFTSFNNRSGGAYFLSFIKIKGKWCPLSTYEGVYLMKNNGVIASVDDVLLDQSLLSPFITKLTNFEADTFIEAIRKMDFEAGWTMRVKGQSPVSRVIFGIKSMIYRHP